MCRFRFIEKHQTHSYEVRQVWGPQVRLAQAVSLLPPAPTRPPPLL